VSLRECGIACRDEVPFMPYDDANSARLKHVSRDASTDTGRSQLLLFGRALIARDADSCPNECRAANIKMALLMHNRMGELPLQQDGGDKWQALHRFI